MKDILKIGQKLKLFQYIGIGLVLEANVIVEAASIEEAAILIEQRLAGSGVEYLGIDHITELLKNSPVIYFNNGDM